ncbi:unnamed protein product [Prunus armeniaca]
MCLGLELAAKTWQQGSAARKGDMRSGQGNKATQRTTDLRSAARKQGAAHVDRSWAACVGSCVGWCVGCLAGSWCAWCWQFVQADGAHDAGRLCKQLACRMRNTSRQIVLDMAERGSLAKDVLEWV